jgi:two-component system chemotaxis response regulator CheY
MERRVIVVVDDTDGIRDLIADTLTDQGYTVVCAANGAEALVVMQSTQPVLILLDLNMPVMDGWQFARALADRSLRIPIVILTAAAEASRHAQELGAAGWLRKPFDLTDLLGMVEHVHGAA